MEEAKGTKVTDVRMTSELHLDNCTERNDSKKGQLRNGVIGNRFSVTEGCESVLGDREQMNIRRK